MQPDIPPHRAEAQERLLVPVSGADETEDCDRELVGNEAIRGKTINRDTQQGQDEEMTLFFVFRA